MNTIDRERIINESTCFICSMGTNDGAPIDIITACCGQPLHYNCGCKWLAKVGTIDGNNACAYCRHKVAPLNVKIVTILIRHWISGEETSYDIRESSKLSEVFNSFTISNGVRTSDLCFKTQHGETIDPDSTVRMIGLKEGDCINTALINKMITISVRHWNRGEGIFFKIKQSTTKLSKVFDAYASREGVDASTLCFTTQNGANIEPDSTADLIGLKHCDRINAVLIITLVISIRHWNSGEETVYDIRDSSKFSEVVNTYTSRIGVDASMLSFTTQNGTNIEPDSTAHSIGLKDGDRIKAILINKTIRVSVHQWMKKRFSRSKNLQN